MKKILFLFCLSSLFLPAESQITKSNWLVGGNGKFYSYSSTYSTPTLSTEGSYTEVSLSPNVGLFLIDKFAVGLRPTFSSLKGEVTTTGGLRTNTRRYSGGPFVRYYFLNGSRSFNLLTDLSYQYGISTLDGKKLGNFSNTSLMLGPVLYFNSSVGLEFLLGYSNSKEESDAPYEQTNKGFQISIGFQIHLKK